MSRLFGDKSGLDMCLNWICIVQLDGIPCLSKRPMDSHTRYNNNNYHDISPLSGLASAMAGAAWSQRAMPAVTTCHEWLLKVLGFGNQVDGLLSRKFSAVPVLISSHRLVSWLDF